MKSVRFVQLVITPSIVTEDEDGHLEGIRVEPSVLTGKEIDELMELESNYLKDELLDLKMALEKG